jgi:hypothetical protein
MTLPSKQYFVGVDELAELGRRKRQAPGRGVCSTQKRQHGTHAESCRLTKKKGILLQNLSFRERERVCECFYHYPIEETPFRLCILNVNNKA